MSKNWRALRETCPRCGAGLRPVSAVDRQPTTLTLDELGVMSVENAIPYAEDFWPILRADVKWRHCPTHNDFPVFTLWCPGEYVKEVVD